MSVLSFQELESGLVLQSTIQLWLQSRTDFTWTTHSLHAMAAAYNAVDVDLGKNATDEKLKNFLGHLGNNFEQQAIKNSYFQSMPLTVYQI